MSQVIDITGEEFGGLTAGRNDVSTWVVNGLFVNVGQDVHDRCEEM
jgi:hypothetical protein